MRCTPCIAPPLMKVKQRKKLPLNEMIELSADFFGFDLSDFTRRNRKHELVRSRFFTFHYMLTNRLTTQPKLGAMVGMDHTSVRHGALTAQNWMDTNAEYRHIYNDYCDFMHSKLFVDVGAKHVCLKCFDKEAISATELFCQDCCG